MPVNKPRPFLLMIDSGSRDEPSNRHYASLEAALAAFMALDERWQRFAWISEHGYPPIIHMRDGVQCQ